MKNKVNVEFNIKLNKEVYLDSPWNTKENFFNQLVVSHIGKDWVLIERFSKKDNTEKEYEGLVNTLKEMKENINNSIKYELLEFDGNNEKLKINFSFDYYDNTKYSVNDLVNTEIFDKIIKASYYFVKDLPRIGQGAPKEKIDSAIKMYQHVGDFMTEAKNSLVIENIADKKTKKKMN